MIESSLRSGGFQDWNDVPLPTDDEILASQAPIKFSAKTSISEKVHRVFNIIMASIVGAKILTLIPAVATAGSTLSGMGFAAISGSAVLQIPAVLAVIAIAPKIIVSLALILMIRKVLAVAINCVVYPAVPMSISGKQDITNQRLEQFQALTEEGFECRRVALNKSGINYDAFVLEHEETKENGQWVLIAGGNGWIGESAIGGWCVDLFKKMGFNILYVNGPGVGASSGLPTSYSIGAGQEAGLQFLEQVVKAKKILLYGTSLGGGAQGEAIVSHEFKKDEATVSHEFKKDIDYMVWTDRSFDTLSNAASNMVTFLAKPIFFLLGIELDGMAGARKLQELGIKHIVTQNSQAVESNDVLPLDGDIQEQDTDGVIPNTASFFVGLQRAGIQDSKRVKCYGGPDIRHNGKLPKDILDLVEVDIQDFLNS